MTDLSQVGDSVYDQARDDERWRLRVLMLEDDEADAEFLQDRLRSDGFSIQVEWVKTRAAFQRALADFAPNLVLADYHLPRFTGIDAIRIAHSHMPLLPVIIVTGALDEESAADCIKAGAADYVLKDRLARLKPAVESALGRARDQAERLEAERALRESEERLRVLFEFAPDAYYLIDLEGTFVDGNRAAEELTGHAREELIGRSFLKLSLLSARQLPQAAALLARSARGKPTGPTEFTLTRKDGDHVTVEIRTFPVTIHGQRLVLGVARDITERKRAQEELTKLHRAVESSGEVVFLTDGEGIFTYVNPEFTRLYGFNAAEVVGKATPRILKSGTCGQEKYQVFWQALLAKETVKGQRVNRTKDGRCVDVEVSVSPVLDDDGAIVAFLAIQSDITERRRAEEALRRSEADYRGIVDNATYGIYRSTPEGRFLSANPALVSMLGYDSEEELLALDMNRNVYAKAGARRRLIEQQVGVSRLARGEAEWRRKDGRVITVRLSGRSVRNDAGEVGHFEMVVEDVTEQRTLESQLRQAQKMEAIGQLTGGIAHDFNNLLSVVIANGDVLKEKIDPARDDLHAAVDDIAAASRNGARLVKRLLGFSRLAELEMETMDLGAAVRDFSSILSRLIPETITVKHDIGTDIPAVQGDRGAVEQILLNLVTNARDAMPEGGDLTLVLAPEVVDTPLPGLESGEYAVLRVTDTGIGMDEATRNCIFEPFFTTKAEGDGTGLGMAMVYGLMKQHGGYVGIDSEPGVGTTIALYFPVAKGGTVVSAPRPTTAGGEVRAGTETILYVEDQDALRRTGSRILEHHGYAVVTAENGEAGLREYERHADEIDLVISDVIMPEMGGYELLRQIRSRNTDVPFVLTSGYSRDTLRQELKMHRNVTTVAKPWTLDELLAAVRQALDANPDGPGVAPGEERNAVEPERVAAARS